MDRTLYTDFFNINPRYYPTVNQALINTGKVSWLDFYPHESFVRLLNLTHDTLSGKTNRSIWVEGAYGTGKSHAVLTVKSMLEASDDELKEYFEKYNNFLSIDLYNKLVSDKNDGTILVVHKITSSNIKKDDDLFLAVQQGIEDALEKKNIRNEGNISLKEKIICWINERPTMHAYINGLMTRQKSTWSIVNCDVNTFIHYIENDNSDKARDLFLSFVEMMKNDGIYPYSMDIQTQIDWIKSVIEKNSLKAILFIWDEFSEYFQNNQTGLTGFQSLVEIGNTHPFYFMIVTHERTDLFKDNKNASKILDRFSSSVKIDLPSNTAFQLMGQALKPVSDSEKRVKWEKYKADLDYSISAACQHICSFDKTLTTSLLNNIVPIHPYAALMLKYISTTLGSNQRSMFDFIVNDSNENEGFKWYISHYGPYDDSKKLLTIDMLWAYFTATGERILNPDAVLLLRSYSLLESENLSEDQKSVLKTVILFEAVSQGVRNVVGLKPIDQNIDMAFSGVWTSGKAILIADELVSKGFLFKNIDSRGHSEYIIQNTQISDSSIKSKIDEIKNTTTTKDLIDKGHIISAIDLHPKYKQHFSIVPASVGEIDSAVKEIRRDSHLGRKIPVVVVFAKNEEEARISEYNISDSINSNGGDILYIDATASSFGEVYFNRYCQVIAYGDAYIKSDKNRSDNFYSEAEHLLADWIDRIKDGSYELYFEGNLAKEHIQSFAILNQELGRIDREKYPHGLENFDVVSVSMYDSNYISYGVECGIKLSLTQVFKDNSLKTELAGAWGIPEYWKTPQCNSPIVPIKRFVEDIIQDGFNSPQNRVCIYEIYEKLQEPPFGFVRSNLTAFIMGFLLREYVDTGFYWSDDINSEPMSTEKMKSAVTTAINKESIPEKKYRNEYITAISKPHKAFLDCTSKIFDIERSKCTTVESARELIRFSIANKIASPIWTLKYILSDESLITPREIVSDVIDFYTGIANKLNSNMTGESELATYIGEDVIKFPSLQDELSLLITQNKCSSAFNLYIGEYKNGELKSLAGQIKDNGRYIEKVRKYLVEVDASNWLWTPDSVNNKIDEVIIDYKIIAESKKYREGDYFSFSEIIDVWRNIVGNTLISNELIKKEYDDMILFVSDLCSLNGYNYSVQWKTDFLSHLTTSAEKFIGLYHNPIPCFKIVTKNILVDLTDDDIDIIYKNLPGDSFYKSSSNYLTIVESVVAEFVKKQARTRLKELWRDITATKDPMEWSEKYMTPVICMVEDSDRIKCQDVFSTIIDGATSQKSIDEAVDFLENAIYLKQISNKEYQDNCFKKRIVGDYSIILTDMDGVRDFIHNACSIHPYYWDNNPIVKNKIEELANTEYKKSGRDKVMDVLKKMSNEELSSYLMTLASDNIKVGIEILKNN